MDRSYPTTLKFNWHLRGDAIQRLKDYRAYAELDPSYRKVITRLNDFGISYHEMPQMSALILNISRERAFEILGDLVN